MLNHQRCKALLAFTKKFGFGLSTMKKLTESTNLSSDDTPKEILDLYESIKSKIPFAY
ncbi:hypothetical protein KG090_03780 [Carnobacteriaceae bacterium zg-ZUI240]|nr:hypothetical protein [Carnobacteriaceae bacterium zg-ZUI240]